MNVNLALKILASGLIVNLALVLVFYNTSSMSVVTLDNKQIIHQMLIGNQGKIEQPNFIESLSACLSDVIEDYANKHQVLILPSQAAIAGNKDITQTIKAHMHQRCVRHD